MILAGFLLAAVGCSCFALLRSDWPQVRERRDATELRTLCHAAREVAKAHGAEHSVLAKEILTREPPPATASSRQWRSEYVALARLTKLHQASEPDLSRRVVHALVAT